MPGFGLPPSAYKKSKNKYPECIKDCYAVKKFGTDICEWMCKDKLAGVISES